MGISPLVRCLGQIEAGCAVHGHLEADVTKYIGVVAGLLLAVTVAGTALAEGNWTSYIINARRSFDSRTWWDGNTDNTSTAIRFDTCRDENLNNGANDWAKVSLQRMRGILPAEFRGQRTLNCYNSDTELYGDQPASDYQFQLDDYSGGTDSWNVFDVGWLKVTY